MKFNTIRFFKGKVVIIVLVFCMISFSGIIFILIKSLKLNQNHLFLIEVSKNIDIEVSKSRINIDNYFLSKNTLSKHEILEGLANANKMTFLLDSILKVELKNRDKSSIQNFHSLHSSITSHINQLQELILLAFKEEEKTFDSAIIQEFNRFQNTFIEYEKNLKNYISKRNLDFKRKIFTLLIACLVFLVLCLVLIMRLINAYYLSERQYADKSIEIELKERKRIAVALHDGLGSLLSSIGLYINLLGKEIPQNELAKNNINQLQQLSDMALESLENAINNLNPSILNKYGLIKALEIICNKLNDIGNIYFQVESENFNVNISKNTELNLYRISNELINNTLKHSHANQAKIEFNSIKKKLYLHYSDNGIGFNPIFDDLNENEKFGLSNIIRRVETLGGSYSIISNPGKGVKVVIQINISKV